MGKLKNKILLFFSICVLLLVAGCGSDKSKDNAIVAEKSLTVTNAWVKATDKNMTAAFGEIVNVTGEDIVIVSAESSLTNKVELHESFLDGLGGSGMKESVGGFVIPGGGQHVLLPGEDHIMLLGLTQSVEAGDVVSLTLYDSLGESYVFDFIAKNYLGANEQYHQ